MVDERRVHETTVAAHQLRERMIQLAWALHFAAADVAATLRDEAPDERTRAVALAWDAVSRDAHEIVRTWESRPMPRLRRAVTSAATSGADGAEPC